MTLPHLTSRFYILHWHFTFHSIILFLHFSFFHFLFHVLHLRYCILCFTFYIWHWYFIFHILHSTFYIFHFTFYILNFTFYVLYLAFYILHSTFDIWHLTSDTRSWIVQCIFPCRNNALIITNQLSEVQYSQLSWNNVNKLFILSGWIFEKRKTKLTNSYNS